MSDSLLSRRSDPDMQAAPRALLRAAMRAREIARATNTAIVIIRDGVLVEERVAQAPDEGTRQAPMTIYDGEGRR